MTWGCLQALNVRDLLSAPDYRFMLVILWERRNTVAKAYDANVKNLSQPVKLLAEGPLPLAGDLEHPTPPGAGDGKRNPRGLDVDKQPVASWIKGCTGKLRVGEVTHNAVDIAIE